jgi:hypothetical protein
MIEFLSTYLSTILIGILFILGYHFFIPQGSLIIKIYLVIVEIILLVMFWMAMHTKPDLALANITYVGTIQIAYIIYLSIVYRNDRKDELYKIIWSSSISPMIIGGLKAIKNDPVKHDTAIKIMKKMLVTKPKFQKRTKLYLSYDKGVLKFSLLFSKKRDFLLYMDEVDVDLSEAIESERVGKGYSLIYEYKL